MADPHCLVLLGSLCYVINSFLFLNSILKYFNFKRSLKLCLRLFRAFDGSHIPVTTGRFELPTSYM